ncbi:hypothetical protein SAMN05216287_2390 [Pseudomonas kuykendallii]|uniref:Uncharacterized protein n=1 Tax=Pseudomonas kuykendallii TaxID=1007099 RepID=A0A1H2ZQT1_9PSED|nr:hypothetical protein SAMN05216287_2390 [Pseudomonas kuykendallii]
MEVGLVAAHSVFKSLRLHGREKCRDRRAGYRPVAALAVAQAQCTSVRLPLNTRLNLRRGSIIVPQLPTSRPRHLSLTTGSRPLASLAGTAFRSPLTKR